MHNFILKDTLWPKETPFSFCKNNIPKSDVKSQEECQSNCQGRADCVGIVYSHKKGIRKWCYMCLDDVLVYGGNGYGFYRRLGNMSFARKLSIGIYEYKESFKYQPRSISVSV